MNAVNEIRENVIRDLSFEEDISEEELYLKIDRRVAEYARERHLSLKSMEELRKAVFNGIRGLDILEEPLCDDSVTEIMINGNGDIFLERSGKMEIWNKSFDSESKLQDIIQKIVGNVNRSVNEASPIADARLPDGSRINVILPPVAIDGPTVTIRKFGKNPVTMEKMIESGTITEEAAEFLKTAVMCRYNMLISGGTGSGKTTFLNALSAFIPEGERVITIEDSAELKIRNVRNLVRLECRNKSSDEVKEIKIRDLIRASLRMRPDRIIVGEVRGAEVIDMLSAMNTGHDGSLSTAHGNSIPDMLDRLATMTLMGLDIPMQAVRQQIAGALDIMVHLARFSDGTRHVVEISEIGRVKNGEIEVRPLYSYDDGELRRTENELENTAKIERYGKKT